MSFYPLIYCVNSSARCKNVVRDYFYIQYYSSFIDKRHKTALFSMSQLVDFECEKINARRLLSIDTGVY